MPLLTRVFLMTPLLMLLGEAQASAANGGSAQAAPNPQLTTQVRVVDPEGKPIAGAVVAPWAISSELGHSTWSTNGRGGTEPPVVRTDENGVAEFEYPEYASASQKIPCLQLTCRVEHRDYADSVYNDVPVPQTGDEPAEIRLLRGAVVRMKPLSEELEPLLDGVHVLWTDPSFWSVDDRPVREGDAFVSPRLSSGGELVRLVRVEDQRATHFSRPLPIVLAEGEERELMEVLEPAVAVRGRLSGNVPRPVKNGRVSVSVVTKAPGVSVEALYWDAWAEVDEDGEFVLEGLPAGEPLQVVGLCDGFIAVAGVAPSFASDRERESNRRLTPQVFPLPAEGTADITLDMEPTGRCDFLVQGPGGQPLPGLKVHAWPNVRWWNGGSQIYCASLHSSAAWLASADRTLKGLQDAGQDRYGSVYSAVTDANGRAVLQNLPLGEFGYRVAEPRGSVHRYSVHEGKAQAIIAGGAQQVTMRPTR